MRALQVQRRTMPSAGLASQEILPLSRFHARSEQRSRPRTPFDPARRGHRPPSRSASTRSCAASSPTPSITRPHGYSSTACSSRPPTSPNSATSFLLRRPRKKRIEAGDGHKSLAQILLAKGCARIRPCSSRRPRSTSGSSASRLRASRDTPRCRCRTVWWTQRTRRKGQVIRIKRQKMWRHRAGNGGAAES